MTNEELAANTFEPLRKHRWLLNFQNKEIAACFGKKASLGPNDFSAEFYLTEDKGDLFNLLRRYVESGEIFAPAAEFVFVNKDGKPISRVKYGPLRVTYAGSVNLDYDSDDAVTVEAFFEVGKARKTSLDLDEALPMGASMAQLL